MIEIKKGKEPKELIEFRKTKYASYDSMPSEIKDKVKESLMRESRTSHTSHYNKLGELIIDN